MSADLSLCIALCVFYPHRVKREEKDGLFLLQQVSNLRKELLFIRRFRSWRGLFGLSFFLLRELVDAFNEKEHAESDDKKVKCRLDKTAIINGGSLRLNAVGKLFCRQSNLKFREVYAANQPPDRGHDDVINNAAHYLSESTANDYTYSHVDSIAFNCELSELI